MIVLTGRLRDCALEDSLISRVCISTHRKDFESAKPNTIKILIWSSGLKNGFLVGLMNME